MNRSRSNDLVSRKSLTKGNQSNSKLRNNSEIFCSETYLTKVKEQYGEISNFNQRVHESLKNYEKQIRNLKVASSLQQIQLNNLRQYVSYYRIIHYQKQNNISPEPCNPEETKQLKKLSEIDDYGVNRQETAQLILQKINIEKQESLQFIQILKDEFIEKHFQQIEILSRFTGFLDQKLMGNFQKGMAAIKRGLKPQSLRIDDFKKNPKIRKNMLNSIFMILNHKVSEQIDWSFRNIIKWSYVQQGGQSLQNSRIIVEKGLYPSINIREAFYRWFIRSTEDGEQLISRASNNLVLYTNISKTTAFYRILATVRLKKKKVHPKNKRMAIMLYLYMEKYASRTQRDAFQIIYQNSNQQNKSSFVIEKIIKSCNSKKIQAFLLWKKKINKIKQNERILEGNQRKIACTIVKAAENRMKCTIKKWKQKNINEKRICCLMTRLFSRILLSRLHELSKNSEHRINLFKNV